LLMVVQLLILPVGFGRFFPRWQIARKRTFIAEPTSRNDPRRRTAARNLAYIDGEPGVAGLTVCVPAPQGHPRARGVLPAHNRMI
jgi:hypothetical protein